ncbi:type II secretion system protein GspM [Pararhizobium gei]|uniref:type II secretion system protein GspM n=1 Tax=Pararhizobium gei TaxID=1395951 RepID=UPI0023DBD33A|nr:type II secretion system protein GspM [Rhizobium gei]
MLTELMNLPPRRRQLAAVFATILAAAITMTTALAFLSGIWENVRAIEAQRETLGKLHAIATAGASFRKQLFPENLDDPKLLRGENEAVVTAALQSWIQEVVSANGGQINSSSNIVENPEAGVRMVGLKINLSGSLETVHRTIASIERNRPRLLIRQVMIHSNYQQLADQGDVPVELTATVSFLGAMSASEAAKGRP